MKTKYYITDSSAFQLWRAARYPGSRFAVQTKASYEPSYLRSVDRARLIEWFTSMGICPPYEFLVADPRLRSQSRGCFSFRLVRSVPESGSFYHVVDPDIASAPFDLYIASPELNFVQMANRLSLIETIGYGYELCGTYTPEECGKDDPTKLLRLSSAKRLATYSKRASGMHGVVQARRAARSVIDNSRSIRETELAMMLTLDRRLHGFNTIRPVLNYSIKVTGSRETFISQDEFSIDFCWLDFHVGIEVETNKFHSGEHKLVKDARRRNSVQYLGFTIIQATQGDLSSVLGIAGLGKQLYEAMGVRPSRGQFDIDLERLKLYEEVFALSNYP